MDYLLYVFFLFSFFLGNSQSYNQSAPKLVVGVVVDQMRYDYLSRFYNRFGDKGFKKLINDGFECKNHHFNYMPTYTGPGHASIFTGTSPKNHGIIANNWYDKFTDKMVYCVSDHSVKPLGTKSDKERMSPHRMLSTTFGDVNRLHTQFRGKTIGVSLKDRGAVLPAGHSANNAYWFRGKEEGKWVSSTYYGVDLPNWVKGINESKLIDNYLKEWNTLYPLKTYKESGSDLNVYEKGFKGKSTATFPYNLKQLKENNDGYDILKISPYGNSIITDFALKAIENEKLGEDEFTDVLTISYSSTDYIGHNFGVNSVEVEDTYLRLDLELARLLQYLDKKVGDGEYILFLTADHGAVHVPSYLKDKKIPAYYVDKKVFKKGVRDFVKKEFKEDSLVKKISNQQLFLNYEKIRNKKLSITEITKKLQFYVSQQKNVQHVFIRENLIQRTCSNGISQLVQNGFHQRLSGDVAYVLTPETISYNKKGSTHGSPQPYDTHVPLLFYGNGIKKGHTFKPTKVVDIAPTICALLRISSPNSATGNVLAEVLKD